MKSLVTILLFSFVLFGCTSSSSGYKEFFRNSAPEKFNPTTKVDVFSYVDPCKIYETHKMFFKNYLLLGSSSFNGPYEDPTNSKEFAMSIGSDVLITHDKFTETTSSGVKRYDLGGIFLKNVKNIKPIFDKTNVDFPKSGISEYDGIWINETYTIKIYKSDEYIVGINKNLVTNEWGNWEPNQVKFLITKDNFGIYMMGAYHPVPAKFEINNFGYLRLDIFNY